MKGWEYKERYTEDLIEEGVLFDCDDFNTISKFEDCISLHGNFTQDKLFKYQEALGRKFTPRGKCFKLKVSEKLSIYLE